MSQSFAGKCMDRMMLFSSNVVSDTFCFLNFEESFVCEREKARAIPRERGRNRKRDKRIGEKKENKT
jgi:hypothetical protein